MPGRPAAEGGHQRAAHPEHVVVSLIARTVALTLLLLSVVTGCGGAVAVKATVSTSIAASTPAAPVAPVASPATGQPATRPHVLLVMEENKGFAATLGSCGNDPYWCSLASTYASSTGWFAISHPSLPNYLAIDSGSVQGCASDSCPGGYTGGDLGGQLTAAGIPWTAYMESMPAPCYPGSSSGPYARKHNPFAYFSAASAACHVQPYPGASSLLAALSARNAPDFVWITPNANNDMHDGGVQQGDAWLRANLPGVLTSQWFADHGTVIITMDENDADGSPGGGQVPMVVVSSRSRGAGTVPRRGNHYGTLRSIEEAYVLPLLGAAEDATNGEVSSLLG